MHDSCVGYGFAPFLSSHAREQIWTIQLRVTGCVFEFDRMQCETP
ncbi:hypothetical protein APA386B_966 [Acetobacter pasteurianus 386B]|nr:hypothetical protein APA386B_966 [Acetobacter pasteurianus 386B]